MGVVCTSERGGRRTAGAAVYQVGRGGLPVAFRDVMQDIPQPSVGHVRNPNDGGSGGVVSSLEGRVEGGGGGDSGRYAIILLAYDCLTSLYLPIASSTVPLSLPTSPPLLSHSLLSRHQNFHPKQATIIRKQTIGRKVARQQYLGCCLRTKLATAVFSQHRTSLSLSLDLCARETAIRVTVCPRSGLRVSSTRGHLKVPPRST